MLIVEKHAFPRDKVCGGCIAPRALALLSAAGLRNRLDDLPALATTSLCVQAHHRQAVVPLPRGMAVSRADFDAMLVDEAIAGGAHFLPSTMARVGELDGGGRAVICRADKGPAITIRAKTVIVADGLSRSSLNSRDWPAASVSPASKLGIGAVVHQADAVSDALGLLRGVIYMNVASSGYVGLSRCGPDRLNVAAAVNAAAFARDKPLPLIVAGILAEAGRPEWACHAATAWRNARWQGTPPLTRNLDVSAAERVIVLGDAAGYVEPFTGEGITWALASAESLARMLTAAPHCWSAAVGRRWQAFHRARRPRQQALCRVLAAALRSPRLTSWAVRAVAAIPRAAGPLVRHWNRPLTTWNAWL